ncbi:Cytochrome c oxidase subunit 4 [Dispira simplex]|nr:Cytochrome c oxidase subunit 4 [Dispira simplex]
MLATILRRITPSSASRHIAAARPLGARLLSVSAVRASAGHDVDNPVVVQGAGAQPGTVPTSYDQAAGLERAELLARLEGRELFSMKPLEMTHLGTKKNPILIDSIDEVRHVGCTGYPAESHSLIWINVERKHEIDRCPECGCVYKMNYIGE